MKSDGFPTLLAVGACVAIAFAVGFEVAARRYMPDVVTLEMEALTPDLAYKGDLVMTVAVGMCGTAVVTDVGFAAADPAVTREIAFHHDTGPVLGLVGVPDRNGVYRCVVAEYANDWRREFRVRGYWLLLEGGG